MDVHKEAIAIAVRNTSGKLWGRNDPLIVPAPRNS